MIKDMILYKLSNRQQLIERSVFLILVDALMAFSESNDYLRISARSYLKSMGAFQFMLMGALMDFACEQNLEIFKNALLSYTGLCTRGAIELRIKEHKLYLKSDCSICNSFKANQFRLFLHSMAYEL